MYSVCDTLKWFSYEEDTLRILRLLLPALLVSFVACTPSKNGLKKVLVENPDILFEVIEKHPDQFLETVNKAAREAQVRQRQKQAEEESQQFEEEFKNPKKPEITSKMAFSGPKDAPITIVEYSDFECPYCSRGFRSVQQVKEKYKGKVKFIYKHLPLDFHPLAMPAAKYFEAVAMQGAEKAYKFHDYVFENQNKLKSGKQKFLDEAVEKAGANLAQVKKNLDSADIQARIDADIAEARKFGISGTPGFLINGVSLKGAYPAEKFYEIIERHLKK